MSKPSNEQRYYDALKTISKYMSPSRIERDAERSGLPVEEYLAMAYENVLSAAKEAVKGRRRPSE